MKANKNEKPVGLVCRTCGCTHFIVTNTERLTNGSIRRRRECRHCLKKYVSIERIHAPEEVQKISKKSRHT